MDDPNPRAADPGSDADGGAAQIECGLSTVADNPPLPITLPSQDVAAAARDRKYLTDAVAGLNREDLAKLNMANELGNSLRQTHAANVLEATLAPLHGPGVGSAGYLAIRDRVLRESGSPRDPVEEMLLEQFTLANYHIGQLHVRAAEAKSIEVSKVYYAALCRMQAESRKLALALQAYRAPPKSSQFTVVKQANIAAGDQQVAFIDNPQNSTGRISAHDAQLITGNPAATPQGHENQAEYAQSAARRGRPRKS